MGCFIELKDAIVKCFKCMGKYQGMKDLSFLIRFSTLLFMGLLALSLISVGLMPWIQWLLGPEKISNSDLLSSSTTIVFISITGVYVLFTYGLVKQNQKSAEQNKIDREISYIERQLEKYYLPLQYYHQQFEGILPDKYESIQPYAYLGSEDITSKVETFIIERDRQVLSDEEIGILKQDFENALKSDIKSIKKELQELVKNE